MSQNFRFNNPKQFSNWILLVSFCSSHLDIKIEKINTKIDFSATNSKKFVYYNEKHEQFQTRLSRKLQRFRRCRKNKKCSILHELSEYQQKWQLFFHYNGPLISKNPKINLYHLCPL